MASTWFALSVTTLGSEPSNQAVHFTSIEFAPLSEALVAELVAELSEVLVAELSEAPVAELSAFLKVPRYSFCF